MAVVAAFYLYPIVDVVRLSLTDADLLQRGYRYTWGSYRAVLSRPEFYSVARVTAIFVAASVIFQLGLGLIIALVVHDATRRRVLGAVAARTAVLTAWAIPGVVIGIIWRMLLSEGSYGIFTHWLSQLAVRPLPFLSTPGMALLSVTVANIWRGTAFSMILQYAGLQTIPEEIYEAAQVDGATRLRQLVHITLPLMLPIMYINLVLITIATFNTFDMVLALTGGGPGRSTEVIALHAYATIFREFDLGRGSAIAVLLLATNLVMVFMYYRLLQRGREVAYT